MANMTFTPPADEKVKDRTKTMTARFWHNNYYKPKAGEIVTASTGRHARTRFGKLRIIKVTEWNPSIDDYHLLKAKTGYTPQQIAEKEGFSNFNEFFNAYAALNNHLDPYDPDRSHWFIEFELIEVF